VEALVGASGEGEEARVWHGPCGASLGGDQLGPCFLPLWMVHPDEAALRWRLDLPRGVTLGTCGGGPGPGAGPLAHGHAHAPAVGGWCNDREEAAPLVSRLRQDVHDFGLLILLTVFGCTSRQDPVFAQVRGALGTFGPAWV
jgi:hypothetical protein